jgi:aminopeptidase N
MAAKIVNPSFPHLDHDLRFLMTHYPAAYQVDRTEGTNPIRQRLTNLDEAGQLYGPIIYQKAPIVMRQLELMLGERGLRDGLRAYLQRYAFANATWLDLVRLLDARTPRNLTAWSQAWVEERGRPRFETKVAVDSTQRISALTLTMRDDRHRSLVWPQKLTVAVGEEGGVTLLDVEVSSPSTPVAAAIGLPRPRFVLPNGAGLGYGLFVLDAPSRDYLLAHIEELPDALTRGSAWVTLWDNLLEQRMTPAAFFDAASRAIPRETDEQNAERVLGYLVKTFWRFMPQDERIARSAAFEALLRNGLDRAPSMSLKAAWFNALRDTALGSSSLAWLERVWTREEGVPGLPLAETDEIVLAEELAIRDVAHADAILREQLDRTQNPDRKARFAFVMPALSADAAVRQMAFDRLRDPANRRREPWVVESLRYLNHPLREAAAIRFLRPALDLLQQIQQTGDIFFPTRWMESTMNGHRSREAADIVKGFLAEHPRYPQRLRWTILAASDETFRAAQLAMP